MKRREFIAAGVAGLALPPSVIRHPSSVISHPSSVIRPVGLQLYTVRSLMQRDFAGTLRAVGAAGYREVEFAGYFGRTPREVRLALQAARLAAPAVHVDGTTLVTGFDQVCELSRAVGHQWVVVAWIPAEMRSSLDDWRRVAVLLNQSAELARRYQLGFAFHNHEYVFQMMDGRLPYDVLLEDTNPGTVKMEMDVYWSVKGGHDPLAYFERWPGRFPMLHVKDLTAAGDMVDVGQGIIDWRAIIAQAPRAGIEHYFVEHDEPTDPLASIRTSYRYLRSL